MIRNLIFDMGNVLIYFNPRHFIRHFGVTDPEMEKLLLREVYGSVEWVLMDWGTLDEDACEACVLPRLPEELWPTARKLIHWWDRPILPVPGMEAFVRKCKAAGYGIYLLSNASRRLHSYWHKVPASELFDGLVVSSDVRLVKPLPDIYHHLLDRFQLQAEECLFVDDMPLNIAGALQVGIPGFVFRDNVEELEQRVFGVAGQ